MVDVKCCEFCLRGTVKSDDDMYVFVFYVEILFVFMGVFQEHLTFV